MKRGAARKPTRHISIEFESQRNIRTSYYFPHAYLNSQASYEARRYKNGSADKRGYNFNSQASYEARRIVYDAYFVSNFISIHRPHTRPDPPNTQCRNVARCFNSHASYEARHICCNKLRRCSGVSIHRPHTRPDFAPATAAVIVPCFNSQASYEARPLIGYLL